MDRTRGGNSRSVMPQRPIKDAISVNMKSVLNGLEFQKRKTSCFFMVGHAHTILCKWIFEFEEVEAIPEEEDSGEAMKQWEPVAIQPKAPSGTKVPTTVIDLES
ncbi:hypothetical protein CTI12_AA153580 [Artemisia annua]|uniref:Uncharacterized protein n=1 Tax=Artemisia annua TaxID=35608 RepID=A0A2U1PH56_ARTAN|nr:hypothetical protein CTI12_AA153580 [Artemisia annua]